LSGFERKVCEKLGRLNEKIDDEKKRKNL